jgi:protein NrfD
MTAVYFLFLFHLSLGLMGALLLVPDKAGLKFFKLCSATAALLTTAGLGFLYRRYGLGGVPSPVAVPERYSLMLAATGAFLVLTVVYNRAWHFDWAKARRPLLIAAVVSGLAACLLSSPGPLFTVADLTSALLLGAAAGAMILGHYYLVVLDLPISALRRLTVLLIVALVLRAAAVGLAFAGPVHAGYEEAGLIARGLWSPDGIFVWMRLLFGIAGPLSLAWFIWKTVEIRSTQSATGILYVQLFLVLAGELLAKYLRVAAGFPL